MGHFLFPLASHLAWPGSESVSVHLRVLPWVRGHLLAKMGSSEEAFVKLKSESEVAQLCPTLLDLTDCSLPGSSSIRFSGKNTGGGAIAFSVLG